MDAIDAISIVAIGLLAMALLQGVKDMVPVRRWFHRRFVRAWLEHKAAVHAAYAAHGARAGTALADLIELATTGDAHALFDLPIEQLCAQASAAAAQSLDYPARHEDLLRCLAASADPRDVELVLAAPEQEPSEVDAAHARLAPPGAGAALIDARTRVMHQVQRSIDALQISAGFRWKWYMQLAAFGFSYALTAAAVFAADDGGTVGERLTTALPLGLVGGLVAPVARDFIATWSRRP